MISQQDIKLSEKPRGFHIITDEIEHQIGELPDVGLIHLFLKHTSAGLCINENADPSVLHDLEMWFDRNVKENEPYYQHTFEGTDDMPAHIKSIMTGCEVTIPINNGMMSLGRWQGIYLAEFRNDGGSRHIIATIIE